MKNLEETKLTHLLDSIQIRSLVVLDSGRIKDLRTGTETEIVLQFWMAILIFL